MCAIRHKRLSNDSRANHPTGISTSGWFAVVKRVAARMSKANIGLVAAGVAFYGLLSLLPGITALVALTGLGVDQELVKNTVDTYSGILPQSAREIVMTQMREVTSADGTALSLTALFSLSLTLYSASRAVGSMIGGLNIVYEEHERRGFFMRFAVNIGLTIGLIIGLVLSIALVAALPAIANWLGFRLLASGLLLARWPVLFVLAGFGIAVLYRLGPARRAAKWRWLTPGAALACTLWVLGSFGFSYYVQNFGNYNETFGALGGVIVLLTWLWLSAFFVLLGGMLDAELEAQTAIDSTIGPARPMGERGAFKADTYEGEGSTAAE